MVEVRVRDAFAISVVIGMMVTVMGSMMAFFATGMAEDGVISSLRTGFVLGLGIGAVVLMFALARVRNHAEKGQAREKARAAEVAALRSEMSHLSDETDGAWIVEERIRRERGVLTFDMHGLDAPMAAGATEKLLGIRESLQRVRIVTGRGEIIHEKSADPGIRPAVLQRLRIGAEAVNWQVLEKAGSITLRPMGIPPTNAQRASRFAIFVIPMCTVMGFTFRDLAGSTMDNQGLAFGVIAGILLTALLSSYRDRSG
ncbi:MAG: hypothetical protein CL971_00980 [Euryarchaeota archaeon]|jgi:hypothetical protein|nr:hypothetical protein [Euryarchaeota archaeon]|tara:strand:- start:491 stop:1261 length:771 start_codon:yes stop_codon:yes gene_type:complete